MKVCSLCKEMLPSEAFAKKGSRLQARCRKCHALYTRRHYSENRQYYLDKAAKSNAARIEANRNLALNHLMTGCIDCRNFDVRVLEFDHLYDKKFNISKGIKDKNYSVLEKEIAKCEVVCANCHAIRTITRSESWKHQHRHLGDNIQDISP